MCFRVSLNVSDFANACLMPTCDVTQCKMNFITVKSTALLSKFFGETEATLRRLFQKARDAAPCVLFFDEFDAIAHNRYLRTNGEKIGYVRDMQVFTTACC